MNRRVEWCTVALVGLLVGCVPSMAPIANQSESEAQTAAVSAGTCTKSAETTPLVDANGKAYCPPGETLGFSGYESNCDIFPQTLKKVCFSCSLGTCGTDCTASVDIRNAYVGVGCVDKTHTPICTCKTACGKKPLSCDGWCANNATCIKPSCTCPDAGTTDIGMPDIATPKDMGN